MCVCVCVCVWGGGGGGLPVDHTLFNNGIGNNIQLIFMDVFNNELV